MTRREHWKQSNPKDQMVAILSAIEGWASLTHGDALKRKMYAAKIQQLCGEAQEVIAHLPSGEWQI